MIGESLNDSIFALSSAAGRAAIAVHRISGPESLPRLLPFLRKVEQHCHKMRLADKNNTIDLKPSLSKYCIVADEHGEIIDDCLITYFKAPHSYTGEDTIEISSHGNPLIASRLHSLFRKIGLREARPGEFTQRAYLNGKMDLTRAEAIDQLIHANTYGGINLARQASEGQIAKFSSDIRAKLTSAMAYFEAHIDFAEDEVGGYDSTSQLIFLGQIKSELSKLAESFSVGLRVRDGLRVALLGSPNAGKSSLYNALLGFERAIVTDIPGTTRDVVEDRLCLNHRDFVLLDTAGIRDTDDHVEKIGVSRSWNSAQKADILCLVVDPTTMDSTKLYHSIYEQVESLLLPLKDKDFSQVIVALTKADRWSSEFRKRIDDAVEQLSVNKIKMYRTSANEGNLDEFIKALEVQHDQTIGAGIQNEPAILISERQKDKVGLAIQSLESAISLVSENDFPEKIASLLIQSAQHVSDLVGEIGAEDVLNDIFSQFCIGK